MLDWCEDHEFVDSNVAARSFKGALPAMPKVKEHLRALPYAEVAAALETIETSPASLSVKLAFRFLVLTVARSGMVRGATWSEIDLVNRKWNVPGSRMKSDKPQRVPLSSAALEVLERARTLRGRPNLLFPSGRRLGRPLSNMAFMKLLRDVGLAERTTAHGLRSSFRDWASEQTSASYSVMEMCLAHTPGSLTEARVRAERSL